MCVHLPSLQFKCLGRSGDEGFIVQSAKIGAGEWGTFSALVSFLATSGRTQSCSLEPMMATRGLKRKSMLKTIGAKHRTILLMSSSVLMYFRVTTFMKKLTPLTCIWCFSARE